MENTSNTRVKSTEKSQTLTSPSFSKKKSQKELKKQLSSFNSSLKKARLLEQIPVSEQNKWDDIISNHRYFDILRKCFLKKTSLSSLPKKLIESNLFFSYEGCQLFIHEKGKTDLSSYFYSKHQATNESTVPVTKYNQLYSLVKKSKNKLFSQEQLKDLELNILGSFLAKDFEYQDHTMILILSRNSFLPSTANEIKYFDSITSFLRPLIKYSLDLHFFNLKNSIYENLCKNFPIPLSIISNTKNDSPPQSNRDFINIIEEQQIDQDHLLKLSLRSKGLPNLDIYHTHRINLLGELLNTLKHEISNPLFGINLGVDLINSENLDNDSKTTLDDIRTSCLRCQKIMDSFTFLYNQREISCQTNVLKLIKETITLTKSETRQIKKEIIFDEKINFDEFEISSNPTYLSQIIFNLIINASQAIQANRSTKILSDDKIQITLLKKLKSLEITVSDTGTGIKKDIVNKLFDPFFTTKQKGTGLGLSICLNLSQQIGAELSCYNNSSGQGSSFCLKIHNPRYLIK